MEVLLKLYGLGLRKYFTSSHFNIADFVVGGAWLIVSCPCALGGSFLHILHVLGGTFYMCIGEEVFCTFYMCWEVDLYMCIGEVDLCTLHHGTIVVPAV